MSSVLSGIDHDLNEADEMARRLGLPCVCQADQQQVIIHMAEQILDDVDRYGTLLEVRLRGLVAECARWLEGEHGPAS